LFWRDRQRDEVTRSWAEINDPVKGLSAGFRQPSILAMVIRPDASEAQNDIAAVSAPLGALRACPEKVARLFRFGHALIL
jgi:hypothetical protein